MKAVVFVGQGKVRVDDVPRPGIQDPDDAVVKISLSAICGSDLHLLDGKTPGMREGGVIGHEFVGTIEELGDGVARHVEGTRVVGSFLIACGTCGPCTEGRFNHCKNRQALGLGTLTGDLDGAQAEYVRVPKAQVNLKTLDGALAGLSNEEALFGGDVLATGFYAASLAEPHQAATIVVIGAGPIGLLTAAALRDRVGSLVVLDTDQQRVDFAGTLGFEALLTEGDDASELIAGVTAGRLADTVIEAVGSLGAFKSAMRCARDGGKVVVVGVYGAERFDLPIGKAWIRSLDIRFAGMANVQAHWGDALLSVAKGTTEPTKLISHRLALDDAVEGYELFASRVAAKVVLTP
jgi:threonine dehydrogenase-like Zn-dependent dehydrogenase